jgi:hypothetical protein
MPQELYYFDANAREYKRYEPQTDWSYITTGKPTTLSGYGITDGTCEITDSANLGKLLAGQLAYSVDDGNVYLGDGSKDILVASTRANLFFGGFMQKFLNPQWSMDYSFDVIVDPDMATGGGNVMCSNGKVVMIPYMLTHLIIFDPSDNTLVQGPDHGKAELAFFGGVLSNEGKVILAPYNSANIGIYDPATDNYFDGPAHGQGDSAFVGAVLLPNGKVILVPNYSTNIGIYDPATHYYCDGPAHGKGEGAFVGAALLPNGEVILAPSNSPNIGIYDPATNYYFDGPSVEGVYVGAVLLPNGKVFLVPAGDSNICIYDPTANTASDLDDTPIDSYGGVLTPNGKVVCGGEKVYIVSFTGMSVELDCCLHPFVNKF